MMNHIKVQPRNGALVKKNDTPLSKPSVHKAFKPLQKISAKANKVYRGLIKRDNPEEQREPFQPEELPMDDSVVEVPGKRVGNYSFDQMLGQGGFGAVYLATEDGTGEQVAIKVQSRNPPKSETSTSSTSREQDVSDFP